MRPLSFVVLTLSLVAWPAVAAELSFEPNQGQSGPGIRYLARTPQGVVFLSDQEMILRGDGDVRFQLVGARNGAAFEPIGAAVAETSYFVGRDRSRWAQHVPSYAKVARRGIYPGIDAVFYGSNGLLEYDFLVSPKADPSRIRFAVEGALKVSIEAASGDLLIEAPSGNLRQRKPVLYQTLASGERRSVQGAFRQIDGKTIGFTVGAYDRTRTLAIDPVLVASTYLGGSGDDAVFASQGSTTVAMTSSADFVNATPAQRMRHDIAITNFLAPYNGAGGYLQTVVYGGSGDDVITSAAFSGNYVGATITIVGYTDSRDLPTELSRSQYLADTTAWAVDYAGGASDGFLLVSNGRTYIDNSVFPSRAYPSLFLTYLGGPGDDRITGFGYNNSYTYFVGTTTQRSFQLPLGTATTQVGPGGGVDGFLASALLGSTSGTLTGISYFGGSGDDLPLGVGTNTQGLVITGETTSPDFPLAVDVGGRKRSGGSDAFVVLPAFGSPSPVLLTSLTGLLYGGSGQDRGIGVAVTVNDNIVIGGTTTSTDLPLASPIQAAYGGGASDVFLTEFSPDLKQILWSTYYGGSGADQLTAVVSDYRGGVAAGGITSSADFPVRNAAQPLYGGGPDDGFVLQLESTGKLGGATFLGGSGSDQVLALSVDYTMQVQAMGRTSSPDFPLMAPSQAKLWGQANGFITRLGDHSVTFFGDRIGGRDLRSSGAIVLGDIPLQDKYPVGTISSSDPSTVLLATDEVTYGTATVDVQGYFYFDCLTDHGGATLTLKMPGYGEATARVTCYPMAAGFTFINATGSPNGGSIPFVPINGTTQVQAYVSIYPAAPNGRANYYFLRPGSDVRIALSSSNPDVAAFPDAFVIPSGGTLFNPPLILKGTGDATLAATPPGGRADVYNLHVISPLQRYSYIPVPAGFAYPIYSWTTNSVPSIGSVTVTSLNPDSVVISTDPTTLGVTQMTVPNDQYPASAYLQAIGPPGDAAITVSADGFGTVTVPIKIGNPSATLLMNRSSTQVHPGDSFNMSGGVTADVGYYVFCYPNPGTPTKLALTNSNSSVLSGVPASIDLTVANGSAFTVSAVGEGSSVVSIQPAGKIAADPVRGAVSFVSSSRALSLPDTTVGNDLVTAMTLTLPVAIASTSSITVSSSNPSLVTVSAAPSNPGTAQVKVNGSGAKQVVFYVQGLTPSGQATINVDAGALGKTTATVQLAPSGWAWNTDSVAATLYVTPSSTIVYSAYALDPATLAPVLPQGVRPGAASTQTLQFDNTNPAVVDTGSSQTPGSVALAFRSVGQASLVLKNPPGFTTPSRRTTFTATVTAPPLYLNSARLSKDMQVAVSLQLPFNAPQKGAFTLTSSDPSKLLISTDPDTVGTAQAVNTGNTIFYLQALDSSGSVQMTASAPGFLDAEATVSFVQPAVYLAVGNSAPGATFDSKTNTYLTTTQSVTTPIVVGLTVPAGASYYGVGLRPGVSDLVVGLQSSNTAVGTIKETSVRLNHTTNLATANFQPLAPGRTTITAVPPAGSVAGTPLTFQVTPPAFVDNAITLGKDTLWQAGISLLSTMRPPANNLNVTITSPDPSRVLLSPDADTDPTPSITRVLIGGQSGIFPFFIHALSSTGTVPLKVSAPGFADSTYTVTLAKTGVALTVSPNATNLILQAGPVTGGVFVQGVLRPGAEPITVGVQSSNESVVTVDPAEVVLTAATSSVPFRMTPVAAGTSTLSLRVPDSAVAVNNYYGGTPTVAVSVAPARLVFGSPDLTISRDSQIFLNFEAVGGFPLNVPITITSSDPSLFLVSASSTTPGTASITIDSSTQRGLYISGLASSGSGTVTASVPGYVSATAQVTLAPSAVVFTQTTVNTALGAKASISVAFRGLNPNTLQPNYDLTPRPGSNLTVTLKSSDAKILAAPATVTIGTPGPVALNLTPLATGTVLLSLGTLPGGPTPASGGQMVVNVTPPALTLANFTLGTGLEIPVRFQIPDGVPTPDYGNGIYVSTSDPNVLLLGGLSSISWANEFPISLPQGQRFSDPLWVQAVGPAGSKAIIQAVYQNQTYLTTVTIDKAAFVFSEANGSNTILSGTVSATPLTLTVIPAVSADGLPLTSPVVPPGAPARTIAVTSSNPGVAQVVGSPITFQPGDSKKPVQVKLLGVGSATITLSGDATSYLATPLSKVTVNVK